MPTVLLVEDSPAERGLLAHVLQKCGYSTVEAGNGEDGLACLTTALPDAVLLELRLPRVDGMSMLRRMREEPKWHQVPVIVLTADSSKSAIMEAARLGISAYLLKSRFVLGALLEAMGRVCPPAMPPGTAAGRRPASGTLQAAPARPATGP